MIAPDTEQVKHRCHECGDTFTGEHMGSGSTPLCPDGCRNPFLACPACGDIFRPEQPPDGQKVYEVHGCKRGKVQARLDNPICLHCGAPKAGVGSPCGCPADTVKRKADADEVAAKRGDRPAGPGNPKQGTGSNAQGVHVAGEPIRIA